jgi:hypothetical protein
MIYNKMLQKNKYLSAAIEKILVLETAWYNPQHLKAMKYLYKEYRGLLYQQQPLSKQTF